MCKMASPVSAPEQERGMTIFLDIFRRADKNDDGFISWEEFISYFADGVMGKEELESLFNEIDTHNTHNIDTGELCAYFSQHLGEFKDIFATLEDLNMQTSHVLHDTSQAYDKADQKGKFVMRFLLREIANQMVAQTRPLESASESLDEQARAERGDITPLKVDDMLKEDGKKIVPGRIIRRAKRELSTQSSNTDVISPAIGAQVERLASLIDRLETKINVDGFRDEEVIEGQDALVLLIQREFILKEENMDAFRALLRSYVDVTQGFNGCINVSVRDLRASHSFSIYEIWTSEEHYIHNCDSPATKTLIQSSAELLEKPETVHSMKIPATWWRRQNS